MACRLVPRYQFSKNTVYLYTFFLRSTDVFVKRQYVNNFSDEMSVDESDVNQTKSIYTAIIHFQTKLVTLVLTKSIHGTRKWHMHPIQELQIMRTSNKCLPFPSCSVLWSFLMGVADFN